MSTHDQTNELSEIKETLRQAQGPRGWVNARHNDFMAMKKERDDALAIHDMFALGFSGEIRLSELYAVENGGFSVTLCDLETNYSATGETPISALLSCLSQRCKSAHFTDPLTPLP